jgi:hypothetical protein
MMININERIRELMRRDPEVQKYEEKLKKAWSNIGGKGFYEKILTIIFLEKLELEKKWGVSITITEDNTTTIISDSLYRKVTDGRILSRLAKRALIKKWGVDLLEDIYSWGLDVVPCSPDQIPIVIDSSTINLNDSKKIKKAFWSIVEEELRKKGASKADSTWTPSPPFGKPKELGFLYRSKDETFYKYLRWYDLKDQGLPFRLIAEIEHGSHDVEKRRTRFDEEVARKKKTRIGMRIPGESAVRRGYQIIYEAIHRQTLPNREEDIKTLENYNCPDHEKNNCSEDCPHLRSWLAKFDHAHKDKPLREKLVSPDKLAKIDSIKQTQKHNPT